MGAAPAASAAQSMRRFWNACRAPRFRECHMSLEELSRKVDELTCRLDCQTAVINFFGALDRKDEALWASTLTDDAKQHSPRHEGGAMDMKNHWKMYLSHTDFFPTHILTNIVIIP